MNTPTKSALMLNVALGLVATKVDAAGPNIKPGLWEITTTIEMPGMPTNMPPMTRTQCYTKKDVQDAKNVTPTAPRKDENCEMKDHKVTSDKVTWTVQCQGKRSSTGTGEMVLKGNTYEGTMKMTTIDPRRGEMHMTQHIKGKRVGDCK